MQTQTLATTDIGLKIISRYFQEFRSLCKDCYSFKNPQLCGKDVEMDALGFSKKMHFIRVAKRDKATLKPIICAIIRPKCMILSDEWPAHKFLSKSKNYGHGTVNDKKEYVNRTTGDHTQSIESWNRQVKDFLRLHQARDKEIDGYLGVFCHRGGMREDNKLTRQFFFKFLSILGEHSASIRKQQVSGNQDKISAIF